MNTLITAGDNGNTPVNDMRSNSEGVKEMSEEGGRGRGSIWGGGSEGGAGGRESSEGGSRGRKRKVDVVTYLSMDQLGMFDSTPSDSMHNE